MYRYFQSYDFNSEIEKEILRSNHLVQVLIDEFGFLRLKKNLLEKLEDGLSVEIILLCPNDKKSIKMVNLAKKITDLNGEIYFVNNEDLLKKNDFFGIFDKVYLISKKNYDKDISNESLFREKNSFFESLSIKSNFLKLFSGNIDVLFESDKTIVKRKEIFKLSWKVKNSHEVEINNQIGLVSDQGSILKSVLNDTKFELIAKNKDFKVKKIVFIKIYSIDSIDFEVSVEDKMLNKFVQISPVSFSEILDNYAVFNNQKVRLSWNISTKGRFYESKLGDLNLKGNYEFIFSKKKNFIFKYLTENSIQSKKLIFHGFDDKRIENKKSTIQKIVDKVYSLIRFK